MYPQSENELEKELIQQLSSQYKKVKINNADDLFINFRKQINKLNQETLNGKDLSDKEFDRLLTKIGGKSIHQSAKFLHDKFTIERDDSSQIYFKLLDTENFSNNTFQITHQIKVHNATTKNDARYDVTLLINGLPLVQIELKNVVKISKKPLIKLIATKYILIAISFASFRFLSSPMVSILNIMPTAITILYIVLLSFGLMNTINA